jgi:DNA-binding LytR/AlgR family response regulator
MHDFKILIVEDEILIADNVARYLIKKGYEVIGIGINYKEAIDLFDQFNPDITLLDIRLNGTKTGIDVAHYINHNLAKTPFIYLTSQMDLGNINSAKQTFPAGYLSKPIHKDNLIAAIEIAMHNYKNQHETENKIALFNGDEHFLIPIDSIIYLKADHVYVHIYRKNNKNIMQRSSLKDLLNQLPANQFLQTHRSYAVNIKFARQWTNDHIALGKDIIPISRSKKKEVLDLLNQAKR